MAHPLESKWVWWYDNPKMKKPEESWEVGSEIILSAPVLTRSRCWAQCRKT